MTGEKLTAREVETALTEANVDTTELTIIGVRETGSVVIEGPKDARREAWLVLMYRTGWPCAPYPEYDIWTRR